MMEYGSEEPDDIPVELNNFPADGKDLDGEDPPAMELNESDNGRRTPDSDYSSDQNDNTSGEFVAELVPKQRKLEFDLPATVTVLKETDLEGEENRPLGTVYLVGTAHFSEESQNDVRLIIKEVQPDSVFLELCESRVSVLSLDEETVLRESQNLTHDKIWKTLKESGFLKGLLHVLLLSMSAHITRQLGMAPGGEFRAAFQEVKKSKQCGLLLGDRPIQITLQRALSSLNLWHKLRLGFSLLASRSLKITKEDVEKVKQKDLLEELLSEMAGEYPALTKIFVDERDQYMAHGLRRALRYTHHQLHHAYGEQAHSMAPVVVGIVGMGHVKGIQEYWQKDVDIPLLLQLPVQSKTSRVCSIAFKGALLGVVGYGLFRIGRFVIRR